MCFNDCLLFVVTVGIWLIVSWFIRVTLTCLMKSCDYRGSSEITLYNVKINQNDIRGTDIGNTNENSRTKPSAAHYNDVIISAMTSQINSLTTVYSAVYSGPDERKNQSSASLAFEREIHRWPVNSPHKWPVTREMFPFDDVIMLLLQCLSSRHNRTAINSVGPRNTHMRR